MKNQETLTREFPRHFYSLDALRGIAALCVVFWHWQHFFYEGTEPGPFTPEHQPLFAIFKPLYLQGWRAVDLFFCLSGFIFYWLYSERLRARELTLKDFAVLRLSRLYPLHFLTLVLVAAGQKFIFSNTGAFFVYPVNDAYHFALQTAFASGWGFERGHSFNGPIWSVSIEILLYGAFFSACTLKASKWSHAALLACGGYALKHLSNSPVGAGAFDFFIGGLCYFGADRLRRQGISGTLVKTLAGLTLLLWVLVPMLTQNNVLYDFYRHHIRTERFSVHGKDPIGFLIMEMSGVSFELLLFPLTILTLAVWEARRGTLGRRLAFLGQISYSSYLLHFPLQMIFMMLAAKAALPDSVFYHPASLALFFAALIPLSLLSYRFIERPCQAFLRRLLLPPASTATHTRRGCLAGDQRDRA